jgi:hypothetical protein
MTSAAKTATRTAGGIREVTEVIGAVARPQTPPARMRNDSAMTATSDLDRNLLTKQSGRFEQ